jgi:hypothetical protein
VVERALASRARALVLASNRRGARLERCDKDFAATLSELLPMIGVALLDGCCSTARTPSASAGRAFCRAALRTHAAPDGARLAGEDAEAQETRETSFLNPAAGMIFPDPRTMTD